MRPENLDKLISQRVSKFKQSKIEKIEEEEEEANSSVVKSEDVEMKLEVEVVQEKDEIEGQSLEARTLSLQPHLHRHHTEPTAEQPIERPHKSRQKSNSFHQLQVDEPINGKPTYQVYATEAQEHAFNDKNPDKVIPKKSISNRKVDSNNISYKTNSVSVLHMLQNKTFSLLKGVLSKGRQQSE